MLHATGKRITAKNRVRFPGIVADAAALGVHRATLFRVLTKEWDLPGLRSRYQKLKAARCGAAARAA